MLNINENIKNENDLYRAKIRSYLTTLSTLAKPHEQQKSENVSGQIGNDIDKKIKVLKLGRSILEMAEMQTPKTKHIQSHANLNSNHSNKSSSKFRTAKSNRDDSFSKVIKIKECATCSQTKDQHSLCLCDSCHLYYHLYCLDPPLRRMPKKNRFGGWQCSNCTEKEQEENEKSNDGNSLDLETHNSVSSSINNESPTVGENGSSRITTRKLRENPKSALKYEEEMNCNSIIPSTSTVSGNGQPNSRGRPRGRSPGKSSANSCRRGRKPKASNLNNSSQTTSRKRKRSVSKEASTLNTLDTESSVPIAAEIDKGLEVITSATTEPKTTTTTTTTTMTTSTTITSSTVNDLSSKASTTVSVSHTTPKKPSIPENCTSCKKETQPKQSVR